jgi:hypothetical protein
MSNCQRVLFLIVWSRKREAHFSVRDLIRVVHPKTRFQSPQQSDANPTRCECSRCLSFSHSRIFSRCSWEARWFRWFRVSRDDWFMISKTVQRISYRKAQSLEAQKDSKGINKTYLSCSVWTVKNVDASVPVSVDTIGAAQSLWNQTISRNLRVSTDSAWLSMLDS